MPDGLEHCPGGALQTTDGSSNIQNCTFSYNSAGQLGGASSADGTNTAVSECLFTGMEQSPGEPMARCLMLMLYFFMACWYQILPGMWQKTFAMPDIAMPNKLVLLVFCCRNWTIQQLL